MGANVYPARTTALLLYGLGVWAGSGRRDRARRSANMRRVENLFRPVFPMVPWYPSVHRSPWCLGTLASTGSHGPLLNLLILVLWFSGRWYPATSGGAQEPGQVQPPSAIGEPAQILLTRTNWCQVPVPIPGGTCQQSVYGATWRERRHANLATAGSLRSHLHVATGPVAQWIRHRPTQPGIAGSSPAGVIF